MEQTAAMEQKASHFLNITNFESIQRECWEADVGKYQSSLSYHELVDYVNQTSIAIQGVRPGEYPVSATMLRLCSMFDGIDQAWLPSAGCGSTTSKATAAATLFKLTHNVAQQDIVKYVHAITGFRAWSCNMLRNVFHTLEQALPDNQCINMGKLGQYLSSCFGSQSRMDYGNGHELSFLFFLCSLFRAGVLQPEDYPAAALMLFARYLNCVRMLQQTFELRPAGFHGAYSVDDYQFVAYLWGAAQLCIDAPFKPREILNPEVYNKWRDAYLLASCIAYVGDTKTGSFATHSSHLWSIAALGTWTQVFDGLHNMYLKGILTEFHMPRNLMFGELMAYDKATPTRYQARIRLGHLSKERKAYLQEKLDLEDKSGEAFLSRERQQQREEREREELELHKKKHLYYDEVQHNALTIPRKSAVAGAAGIFKHLLHSKLREMLAQQHSLMLQPPKPTKSYHMN